MGRKTSTAERCRARARRGSRARGALAAAALLALLPACRACERGAADRPTRFIARDAEGVVEIRDLAVLIRARARLPALVDGLMTPQDLEAVEQEVARSLGFDPTTEQGLEAAGLPKSGPLAVELAAGAAGALWVVPVRDEQRFEKALDHIARARANVESTEKVKIAGKDATV